MHSYLCTKFQGNVYGPSLINDSPDSTKGKFLLHYFLYTKFQGIVYGRSLINRQLAQKGNFYYIPICVLNFKKSFMDYP